MKTTKKAKKLIEQMMLISSMERGKVCKMKDRIHFNHQTWQNGANKVQYVHKDDIQDLKQDIMGYEKFIRLAHQYADEIIRLSRRERDKNSKKRRLASKTAKQTENN